MIKFDILTLFPEIFPNTLETSVLGNAVRKNLISFNYVNIRDFSNDKHNKVDDYPYGGGCGMLMQPQPIYDAYKSVVSDEKNKPLTVFMSPRGRKFTQEIAKEMVAHEHIVLICGHYEGIDQRVIDEIGDFELSIGDFVLTGGELAAMVVCDSVSRLVPGVLAEEEGFVGESHYNGLLEYPQYTRPPVWKDREVPGVLLSGHQQNIDAWRREQSLLLTEQARPDIFCQLNEMPSVSRKLDLSDVLFELIGYSEQNEDSVFKEKRKLYQKLLRKNFPVKDVFCVIKDKTRLLEKITSSKCPIVVISDAATEEVFDRPVMWIGDRQNTDNLYPYMVDINATNSDLVSAVTEFLSISSIILKYSK